VHSLQLPNDNSNEENPPNFLKLLNNKDIIIDLLVVVINLIANTYYFPSLTNHLTIKWKLSVEIASLFFMINMLAYFIAIQFLDYVTNKIGFINTIWSGLVLIFLGVPFVYPLSFLPQNTTSIVFGLSLIGASGASVNVPVIMEVCRILKENDTTLNEILTNDIASAMYNFAVNIGDFCGPVIGGFLSEKYGFNISCGLVSLVSFIFGVVFVFMYKNVMIKDLNYSGKNTPLINDNDVSKISNINIFIKRRRTQSNSFNFDDKLSFLTKYQGNELY
jgi:predicted MFS family arabinose efflux permease